MKREILKVNNDYIRKLNLEDVEAYKAIRLEALQNAPHAFGSSVEEEKKDPERFFKNRILETPILGLLIEEKLEGIAGYALHKAIKRQHIASIWGIYVRPEFRGRKISKRLIEQILSKLPESIEQIYINVESSNTVAKTLYESLGFEEYGMEKRALKIGNKYYDEVLMVKRLQ